ncbi:MAG: stage II sporulation protein R [Peptococcaceae bacterium]|nr:stage II sporulation protein R [Peptococcaceae bacterium]
MKNRLKRVTTGLIRKILICACLAAAAFAVWPGPGGEEAAAAGYQGQLIRFHVIADSDSPADQALKLKVRDAVVRRMTPVLAGVGDIEEARARVDASMDIIKAEAAGVLRENGCRHPVEVMRGRFEFPQKTYRVRRGDNGETVELKLPAGNYEAVRVVIGSGKGANWWCVLFPPLCFVQPDREPPAGVSDDREKNQAGVPAFKYIPVDPGMAEVKPAVEYRFKVVDWYHKIRNWKLGSGN